MENKLNQTINFLIFDMRSGSTFLSSLLDSIEDIGVTLESSLLQRLLTGPKIYKTKEKLTSMVQKLYNPAQNLYADLKFLEWNISKESLLNKLSRNLPVTDSEFVYFILEEYFSTVKPAADVWIYKETDINLIKRIPEHFPKAKCLFIYRDGRAVFSSKKRAVNLNTGQKMAEDPVKAAKIWMKNYFNVKKYFERNKLLMVKYEDLIKNTSNVINEIHTFLTGKRHAETPDQNQVDQKYFLKIPEEQKILHPNIRKGPLLDRIDAWKNEISFAEQYFYEKTACDLLKKLGYETNCLNQTKTLQEKKAIGSYIIRLSILRFKSILNKIKFYCNHPKLLWRRFQLKIKNFAEKFPIFQKPY